MAEWHADDDTDLEYLAQHIFLAHGLDPTGAELRAVAGPCADLERLRGQPAGGYLMNAGSFRRDRVVPAQHLLAHDRRQITTESLGQSRRPATARDYAGGSLARITNEGLALHGAQYYAAMYAAASFESDVPTLVQLGLAAIRRVRGPPL
jgi:hypothetical protein